MNTNDQNKMEMLIFDLLEGNLSASEAAEVMRNIEKDAHWSKEFQLMKATYLQPEPTVLFPNKEALYRKAAVVPIWKNNVFRYAAGLTLLAVSVWVLRYNTLSKDMEKYAVSGHNTAQKATIKSNTSSEETVAPTEILVNTKSLPTAKAESANPSVEFTKYGVDLIPAGLKLANLDTVKNENNSVVANANTNTVLSRTSLSAQPGLAKDTMVQEEFRIVLQQEETKAASYKNRRTLVYRLLNTGRTMLANLSLPNIDIEKKNGKYKLEIFTYDKTEQVANLE